MSTATLRRLLGSTAAITLTALALPACSESPTAPTETAARATSGASPAPQAAIAGGAGGQRVASAASLLARTHHVFALVNVPTSASLNGVVGQVLCPLGEVATGGGFSMVGISPGMAAAFKALQSIRISEGYGSEARSGWRASFYPGAEQYTGIVHATCVPTT